MNFNVFPLLFTFEQYTVIGLVRFWITKSTCQLSFITSFRTLRSVNGISERARDVPGYLSEHIKRAIVSLVLRSNTFTIVHTLFAFNSVMPVRAVQVSSAFCGHVVSLFERLKITAKIRWRNLYWDSFHTALRWMENNNPRKLDLRSSVGRPTEYYSIRFSWQIRTGCLSGGSSLLSGFPFLATHALLVSSHDSDVRFRLSLSKLYLFSVFFFF